MPDHSPRSASVHQTTTDTYPDRKSTRLNSSHVEISYAVFCLKKKKKAKEEARMASESIAALPNSSYRVSLRYLAPFSQMSGYKTFDRTSPYSRSAVRLGCWLL